MTILAFLGRDDDGSARLVSGLDHHRISENDRTVWLAWKGPSCSGHAEGDLAVASEGQGGPATIAQSYRRHGLGCVRELWGPFAFVLYDKRQQLFFASSDVTSRTPLAYWFDRDALVVSQRALRILAHPRVHRGLDETYLAHLMTGFWSAPVGTTAIASIRRLPPGAAIVAHRGRVDLVKLDRLTASGGPLTRKRSAWVDAFWSELEVAVRHSVRSDVTCLSMSGGLDSAALASVISRCSAPVTPMAAFSIVGREGGADELQAIEELERAYTGSIVNRRVDCSDAIDISGLHGFELQDNPTMTPLAYLPARLRLWHAMRAAGFLTVLDGEGGDELFGMLVGARDAMLQGRWITASKYLATHRARRSLFARAFVLPASPAWIRRAWARRRARRGERLPSFLSQRARSDPAIQLATYQFYEGEIDGRS